MAVGGGRRVGGKDHHPHASCSLGRIVVVVLLSLIFGGILALPPLWNRIGQPFLCTSDGISMQCPPVREPLSLWENPPSATKSWTPCAERRRRRHETQSSPPPEGKQSGYLAIHAEGGLNQQRISICNAVAVAKILNAVLIVPLLKQDHIWKDHMRFEDIFDVEHFIEYLKDDVRILREIPSWLPERGKLYTSSTYTVKNIPKYASAEWYVDNVLPRIKEKRMMALKPFVNRLGYSNVPAEINRLRCKVNYHALKFLPYIEGMAETLSARMRNRTGAPQPYMALHLRFEKGSVGLSFCDFVGSHREKVAMSDYRKKEWPDYYQNGSHLWLQALRKRKEGRCGLEPGEVAVLLVAMGYTKETQIYVAGGDTYGGDSRIAPLRHLFPNLARKEDLASEPELLPFKSHVTSLAALDFLVSLKSNVFVMTHGGNFAKLIVGSRRYMGHHLKSIKPNKGPFAKALGDPTLGWAAFLDTVNAMHQGRTGLPQLTLPGYDIYENPLSFCMCRL